MSKSSSPLAQFARCRPPSSPPRRAAMSTAPLDKPQSRTVAALANLDLDTAAPRPYFRATKSLPLASRVTTTFLKPSSSVPTKKSLVRLSPATTIEKPTEAHEALADLPVYSYKTLSPAPTMRFTRSEADADKWVQELDHTGPISMDLEWVVVYRKGGMRPVSLVQVADKKNIIVIQLRTSTSAMARFPVHLQRLLEDPEIPKMGANILNDARKLFKDYGIMMANVVELGALARQADPACTDAGVFGTSKRIVALAKLVERCLHKKLRKDEDVRVSNWEDPKLERKTEMLEYAANDAYCGLQVYHHLIALANSGDVKLDPAKYTSRVHHEPLASPVPPPALALPASPVDLESLPPVEVIYYTAEMEHAGMSSQQLRAYRHWHLGKRDIDTMCKELCIKTGETLKRGTIIAYVINAIKCWPSFAQDVDLGALRLLIQTDLKSWEWHYEWLARAAALELPTKK
ncbi:ribonuclease H-like protein [Mycena belliarum]|uniref:3'-5' exonuclease n=1 Tax=Mycena belliarum TaxID=1033014 RepID=A0AAD6U2H7_9AGAR|nr:ribonuclease H-like protein [Mycena belliae]